MKSIIISQSDFESIEVSEFIFTVNETNREFKKDRYPVGVDENDETIYADLFESFVRGEATAKLDELEIKFYWIATGGDETYSDAFDFTIEIDSDSQKNFETNFTIEDDEGEKIEGWFFENILKEKFNAAAWEWDVMQLLPKAKLDEIDVDEDLDMKTFTIEIDSAPNFRFTGELVASVASSEDMASGSSYSGRTGRWTELALYKTTGGKFVCHQVGRTSWQGERDRFSGKVCETLEEVKEYFGHRWLAKELYSEASIDDFVEVE